MSETLRKIIKEGRYSPSGDGITLVQDPNGNVIVWTECEYECSKHGNIKQDTFQFQFNLAGDSRHVTFCMECVVDKLISLGVAHIIECK